MNNKIKNFGKATFNVYCKTTVVGKIVGYGIKTYQKIKFMNDCKNAVKGVAEYFEKSENWFEETSKNLEPEDFHDEMFMESFGEEYIDV